MSQTEADTDTTQTDGSVAQSDTPKQADQASAEETAKTTGRGFLIITVAKVWFMVTGAVIQLGLPIFLGSPEKFGVFKIVTESISLVNMVMITGTLQAVSKLVSEKPSAANRVVNQALKLQCFLGVPIAVLYFVGSPWIAEQFHDPSLTTFLRLSSLIVLFYAFYAVFIGYFNGIKDFVRQATMDITFATMKVIGIVGLVLLGFGVGGAVAGFVGAAGFICVFAAVWVWRRTRTHAERFPAEAGDTSADTNQQFKRLLGYLVMIMAYTFALNGLMRADLFVLKRVSAELPAQWAGAEALFKLISNKFAGFDGAVLNIARIPYQGVIAVTFVIFPLISASTFNDDRAKTQAYIRDTFRYCMLLIAVVGGLLALNADSIIAGLYSVEYQAASSALAILSVSIVFFALLYVATTIIIGAGRPGVAVVIMTISLALSAGLNYWMVSGVHDKTVASIDWTPKKVDPHPATAPDAVHNAVAMAQNRVALAGPYLHKGPDFMEAGAIATTIAMFCGFLLSLLWLWHTFGAGPPPLTVARILAALGALFGVDYLINLPPSWVAQYGRIGYLGIVVAKMCAMGLVFLIVLFVLREFTDKDLARVKAVIGKKKKS